MRDRRIGDGAALFFLGIAIGASVALLTAPTSGATTRARLRRRREEVADYLIETGKDLMQTCEDLCERGAEVAGDTAHELSAKYRKLHDYSKELLEEAESILRHAKAVAIGR
jgi:gas vesicle protein